MMLVDRTRDSKAISWLNRVSYCYLHWSLKTIIQATNMLAITLVITLGLSGQAALSFRERHATASSTDGATMVHGNYFDLHKYGIRMSDSSKGTVISANHFRACNQAYIHLASASHIEVTSNSFRVMRTKHFTPVGSGAPRNITIANNINFNPFHQNLTPFLTGKTLEVN